MIAHPFLVSMTIDEMADIIGRITDGFENAVLRVLDERKDFIVYELQEQMYSGMTGEDEYISPNYDDDPFFDEEGYWHGRSKDYKAWKKMITPPIPSSVLGLPPRPDHIPNLWINDMFYSDISAKLNGNMLDITVSREKSKDILGKFGESLFTLGTNAVGVFNTDYLEPNLEAYFANCGYQ